MDKIISQIAELIKELEVLVQKANKLLNDGESFVKAVGGLEKLYVKLLLVAAGVVLIVELTCIFGQKFAEFIFR